MIFEFCEGCAFNKDERCNFKYKDQLYSVKTENGKECNMYTTQEEFEKFLRLFDELKKEEEENGHSTD